MIGLACGDGGTPEDGFADAAEVQAFDQAIDPLALAHEDDPVAAIVQMVQAFQNRAIAITWVSHIN